MPLRGSQVSTSSGRPGGCRLSPSHSGNSAEQDQDVNRQPLAATDRYRFYHKQKRAMQSIIRTRCIDEKRGAARLLVGSMGGMQG